MALVMPPKSPEKGVVRCQEAAWCQSTWPVATGMTQERKAGAAETTPTGVARRVTQLTPARLSAVKATTMAQARAGTGTPGRYHWWSAEAEGMAVTPAGGHPSPPVADPGEVGEDGAVGAEGLGAGGGDAPDTFRHIRQSSTQPGAAAQPSSRPTMSGGPPRCPGRRRALPAGRGSGCCRPSRERSHRTSRPSEGGRPEGTPLTPPAPRRGAESGRPASPARRDRDWRGCSPCCLRGGSRTSMHGRYRRPAPSPAASQ
jgi:hypothetical protein